MVVVPGYEDLVASQRCYVDGAYGLALAFDLKAVEVITFYVEYLYPVVTGIGDIDSAIQAYADPYRIEKLPGKVPFTAKCKTVFALMVKRDDTVIAAIDDIDMPLIDRNVARQGKRPRGGACNIPNKFDIADLDGGRN